MDDTLIDIETVPGGCGSIGPFGSAEYCQPHCYARDITSGAGNCVCGAALPDDLHVQAAPGVPIPDEMRRIAKGAEPQRYVLGVAYQPGFDKRIQRGQDGGRDAFTEAELEKAAWQYLKNGPRVGLFHMDGTDGSDGGAAAAEVVESYIYRGDPWDLGDGTVVTKGTWLVGMILSPAAWRLYEEGRLSGLSPQGTARRRRLTSPALS